MARAERTEASTRAIARSDHERAWRCLLALARRAARGRPLTRAALLAVDESGRVHEATRRGPCAFVYISADAAHGFCGVRPLEPDAAELLALFLPLVTGRDSAQLVVAHLGQSADGYAATFCGRTKFITGEEDIRHTHRMRALCDAVLVGASTVAVDDPLLTTRLVEGRSPVRVVLDPCARLRPDHQVFREQSARTLLCTEPGRLTGLPDHVELLQVPRAGAGLDLERLLLALRARGLSRIFIEGGARTIDHFLQARLLHRLQLAVAPVNLGPGPQLPANRLSPRSLLALGRTRRFNMGRDVLYETQLRDRAALLQAGGGA